MEISVMTEMIVTTTINNVMINVIIERAALVATAVILASVTTILAEIEVAAEWREIVTTTQIPKIKDPVRRLEV